MLLSLFVIFMCYTMEMARSHSTKPISTRPKTAAAIPHHSVEKAEATEADNTPPDETLGSCRVYRGWPGGTRIRRTMARRRSIRTCTPTRHVGSADRPDNRRHRQFDSRPLDFGNRRHKETAPNRNRQRSGCMHIQRVLHNRAVLHGKTAQRRQPSHLSISAHWYWGRCWCCCSAT